MADMQKDAAFECCWVKIDQDQTSAGRETVQDPYEDRIS